MIYKNYSNEGFSGSSSNFKFFILYDIYFGFPSKTKNPSHKIIKLSKASKISADGEWIVVITVIPLFFRFYI